MELQQMNELKDGDKVVLSKGRRTFDDSLPAGTILTRKKTWLDDDLSVQFTYVNKAGDGDFHFFTNDEIDFIKE